MAFKSFIGKQIERGKLSIEGKLEERRKLKTIFKETLAGEKIKFAKERAKIEIEAVRKRAIERAKTTPLMRISKGVRNIGVGLAKLEKQTPRMAHPIIGGGFDIFNSAPAPAPAPRRKHKRSVGKVFIIRRGVAYPTTSTKTSRRKEAKSTAMNMADWSKQFGG